MKPSHYAVLCGLVVAIGGQLLSLPNWHAITPGFVGSTCVVIGTTVGAMFTAKPFAPAPPSVDISKVGKP